VGAHFQHITSMPFKLSAKLDCSQCHVKPTGPYSPGHIDTALPAEINFGTLATSGAQNGYSSAAHQPSYNYATKQCSNVWCHGAGMNSNEGTGPYGSVGPIGQGLDGGTLGAPDAKAAIWNSPYLATAVDKCQTCHATPPAAPESGYMHYDDDTGAPYARNKCTNCHRHLNSDATAFTKPELHVNGLIDSCYVCHGRPPIDDETLTKPAIGALNIGMVGAHQAHRLNPAIGNDCNACHYNFTYDMPSYKLEIGFRAYGNRVTKGVFYGMSTLPSVGYSQPIVYFSTWTSTKVRRTTNTAKINTCENIYCHGGGTNTLPALGGGSNNKPNWEAGSSQAVCGACHGVTGDTYRTRGSHGAHVGTGFGEPKLACANCHGIKENNYHVDGKVEWEFYTTAKRLNQTAGYSGTGYKPAGGSSFANNGFVNNLAPSASYGTCQVYCHSDVSDKSFKIPTWGAAAMTCDSCHRNQTSTGRYTGSHQKHTASSTNGGYSIDCLICHSGSGAGSALHVNGTIDIIFNTAVTGSSAVYSSGQCFNIACHVTTVSTGPTWGNAGTLATYPATCVGCHSGEVGNRDAIVPQFGFNSHHVQRSGMVQGTDCAMCHWEGANDGSRNTAYHAGTLASSGNAVNLVIWTTSNSGAKTPADRPAAVRGTTFISYTANGTRGQLTKLNTVCLGCHNANNDSFQPFGDGKTPKQYAWDGLSIDARYTQAGTTTWGKYAATTNAAQKNITKAFSAHGNAANNSRGWDTTNGVDGAITNTSSNVNVLCFDCHNSHGTSATGIMSSYSSATGRSSGAILKSTNNGKGGYSATYVPTAGGSSAAPDKNAYNPGAALCFDCHNNRTPGGAVPWGYNGTFGATQAIYGYRDTPYFGNYSTSGAVNRYPYKRYSTAIRSSKLNHGGHFGASTPLTTTAAKPINGLCTPCHDPHGVSTTLTQANAVPLLKGTWLTSPWKEDVAPANINEARGGTNKDSSNGTTGGSSTRPARQLVGSTPLYRIDQNTFGAQVTASMPNFGSAQTATSWTKTAANFITETDTSFAGLCMQCHSKAQLAPKAGTAVAPDAWKSMTRIHGTVKGWSTTASGTNGNYATAGVNKMHNFSCSKCHTPHNSNLPRLMVTNCLDVRHRGRVATTGTVNATATTDNSSGLAATVGSGNHYVVGDKGKGRGKFPIGGGMWYKNDSKEQNYGTGAGVPFKWFFGHVNDTSPTVNTCHDTATAGGTSGYPNNMMWNTKTPW